MKINQVGIQSYQNINRPDAPGRQAEQIADIAKQPEQKITLVPQTEAEGSKLAVRASGNGYADMLTQTERTALDLLFAKYQERAKMNATYGKEQTNHDSDHGLGLLIDCKG